MGEPTSSALKLFGTDEPVPETPLLRAGPLEASLDAGNLRHIKLGGREAIRAISYIVRDRNWGTYNPEISNLRVDQDPAGFRVTYDAVCRDAQQAFAYRATITADARGQLSFVVDGEAQSEFTTNRTGFVVLHPSEAAGGRLTIHHSDGQIEETVFPEAISPDQPAFDISAVTHEPAPGVSCTVAMEGDAFEMEDQRNWTDASFKTYIRPLSKPRPYVIAKGERHRQRITVTTKAPASAKAAGADAGAKLTLGAPAGRMPSMALFLEPDEVPSALAHAASVGTAQDVIIRFDGSRGVLRPAEAHVKHVGFLVVIHPHVARRQAQYFRRHGLAGGNQVVS